MGSFFSSFRMRPQQPPVHPLDDHVDAAALFAVVGLHHAGVVQRLADLLFAIEALEQDRVGFHLRVGHLDGHLLAGLLVGRLVKHRHAGAGNRRVDAVVVKRLSGFKLSSWWCLSSWMRLAAPPIVSRRFVRKSSRKSKESMWPHSPCRSCLRIPKIGQLVLCPTGSI